MSNLINLFVYIQGLKVLFFLFYLARVKLVYSVCVYVPLFMVIIIDVNQMPGFTPPSAGFLVVNRNEGRNCH